MNKKIIKLTQMGVLCAISVVLVFLIRIPLIPSVGFLQYDMADVPIIICSLLFGSVSGLIVLIITSFIQAFMLGGDGWVGLIMHFFASGLWVLVTGIVYSKHKTIKNATIGMALGSIAMTAIMIPLNYIFTVNFYGIPVEVVSNLMLPGIIPFNLLKGLINSIISIALFKVIRPFVNRYIDR